MIIDNLAASFPTRKVTNAEVVELIRERSPDFEGDIDKALRIVKTLLDRSGLVTRNWCAPGEQPIDHLATAIDRALTPAMVKPQDVDLFIYVGIGGGFREPANSYMVAKALGFTRAECFDVTDACMSWTRAMSLVDSLFKTRNYRCAMVVNAEFNMIEGGPLYPGNFTLRTTEQLEYALPSYTIGEVATATLLSPQRPDNFKFTFLSRPDLANLCTIPTPGFEGFCKPHYHVGRLGAGRFTALGGHLHENLYTELPKVLEMSGARGDDVDVVFTHTSSQAEWQRYGEKAGLDRKIFHVYHQTGNVVSASIPATMALARAEDRLRKGDKVLSWMGSAGMSFNVTTFEY